MDTLSPRIVPAASSGPQWGLLIAFTCLGFAASVGLGAWAVGHRRANAPHRLAPDVPLMAGIPVDVADSPGRGPRAIVETYGRYEAIQAGSIDAQGTSGGVVLTSHAERHIEETKHIPCRLGETWGFTFRWEGLPAGRAMMYRSIMQHPPIPQPDGTVLTNSVVNIRVLADGLPPRSEMWTFLEGYEYELVPGLWTREIYLDDVAITSVTFRVVVGGGQQQE